MKNFIVSYDLNGRVPTHAQMDAHIRKGCYQYARVLETVWFVQANLTADQLAAHLLEVMSKNDRLVVVEGTRAIFQNLLVDDHVIINAWNNRLAA